MKRRSILSIVCALGMACIPAPAENAARKKAQVNSIKAAETSPAVPFPTQGVVPNPEHQFFTKQSLPVEPRFEKRIKEQINKTLEKTRSNPQDDKNFSRLAQLYQLINDEQQALANWNKAISLNKRSAFYFEARGAVRLRADDIAGGVEDLSQAIALNKDTAGIRIARGSGYSALGKHDLAIADFRDAIKKDPKAAFPYAALAKEYQILNKWKECIDACHHGIALSPLEPVLFVMRGQSWAKLGQKKNSEIDFHRAQQLGWSPAKK